MAAGRGSRLFQILAGVASIAGLGVSIVRAQLWARWWNNVYPGGQLVFLLATAILFATLWIRAIRQHNFRTVVPAVDPATRLADRRLYDEFIKLLPSRSGSVSFVYNHPFDLSFDDDALRGLDIYESTWRDAEHVFHDPELECAPQAFDRAVTAFNELMVHVFKRDDTAQYRVYPKEDLDWETETNHYAHQAVRALNAASVTLFEAHQHLVLTARRRLAL